MKGTHPVLLVPGVPVVGPRFSFGSAHSGGWNVVFCGRSVRTLSYSIDPELNGRLGNRKDRLPIDMSRLQCPDSSGRDEGGLSDKVNIQSLTPGALSYSIDPEINGRLGNRKDRLPIDMSRLQWPDSSGGNEGRLGDKVNAYSLPSGMMPQSEGIHGNCLTCRQSGGKLAPRKPMRCAAGQIMRMIPKAAFESVAELREFRNMLADRSG